MHALSPSTAHTRRILKIESGNQLFKAGTISDGALHSVRFSTMSLERTNEKINKVSTSILKVHFDRINELSNLSLTVIYRKDRGIRCSCNSSFVTLELNYPNIARLIVESSKRAICSPSYDMVGVFASSGVRT